MKTTLAVLLLAAMAGAQVPLPPVCSAVWLNGERVAYDCKGEPTLPDPEYLEFRLPIVTRHPTLPLPEVERPIWWQYEGKIWGLATPTRQGRLWREDCCGGVVPVESLDVPAIQETRHTKCISAYLWPGPACQGYEDEMVTTCADKTRILEHDEQPAPNTKFWCRKVQSR